MFTIFAIPKPFHEHTAIIQRNAIRSWMLLRPACEIILFGDDEGTAETAEEFGVQYIPEIARNEYGTPLLNDLFDQAQHLARYDLLCYVNADIVLLSDFMRAVERVARRKRCFLMVGQRWDVDVRQPLDFGSLWEERLRISVAQGGQLHRWTGIDYFVFPRGLWGEMPPFAIGRTAWDNWLIYRARSQKAAVVDASRVVMAIHQNHDWSHIAGGKHEAWKGPEARRNRDLAGEGLCTLLDATWLLTPRWLIPPAWTKEHRQRRREVCHAYGARLAWLGFEAHQRGQLRQAAGHFMRAFRYRPSLLKNLGAMSILLELVVGSRLMSRLRTWRRTAMNRSGPARS